MGFFQDFWEQATDPDRVLRVFCVVLGFFLFSYLSQWIRKKREEKKDKPVLVGGPLSAEEQEELHRLMQMPWEGMTEEKKERWRDLLRKMGSPEWNIAWNEKYRSRKKYKELTLAA